MDYFTTTVQSKCILPSSCNSKIMNSGVNGYIREWETGMHSSFPIGSVLVFDATDKNNQIKAPQFTFSDLLSVVIKGKPKFMSDTLSSRRQISPNQRRQMDTMGYCSTGSNGKVSLNTLFFEDAPHKARERGILRLYYDNLDKFVNEDGCSAGLYYILNRVISYTHHVIQRIMAVDGDIYQRWVKGDVRINPTGVLKAYLMLLDAEGFVDPEMVCHKFLMYNGSPCGLCAHGTDSVYSTSDFRRESKGVLCHGMDKGMPVTDFELIYDVQKMYDPSNPPLVMWSSEHERSDWSTDLLKRRCDDLRIDYNNYTWVRHTDTDIDDHDHIIGYPIDVSFNVVIKGLTQNVLKINHIQLDFLIRFMMVFRKMYLAITKNEDVQLRSPFILPEPYNIYTHELLRNVGVNSYTRTLFNKMIIGFNSMCYMDGLPKVMISHFEGLRRGMSDREDMGWVLDRIDYITAWNPNVCSIVSQVGPAIKQTTLNEYNWSLTGPLVPTTITVIDDKDYDGEDLLRYWTRNRNGKRLIPHASKSITLDEYKRVTQLYGAEPDYRVLDLYNKAQFHEKHELDFIRETLTIVLGDELGDEIVCHGATTPIDEEEELTEDDITQIQMMSRLSDGDLNGELRPGKYIRCFAIVGKHLILNNRNARCDFWLARGEDCESVVTYAGEEWGINGPLPDEVSYFNNSNIRRQEQRVQDIFSLSKHVEQLIEFY